jgi:hypothetical protein
LASNDVAVADFPCGNEGVKLRPTAYGFFECLDLGDVGDLMIEAAEGLVVIDVIRDVVHEVFEVQERAREVVFDCGDILQSGSAVETVHDFDQLKSRQRCDARRVL